MGSRISPTAHYTGHIWVRNGIAAPALGTLLGRAMYRSFRPISRVTRHFMGGVTLESYLLERHKMLDLVVSKAIEEEGALQVLEVASGLSPRGYRFARRYQDRGLSYLEADLPAMAARKRGLLRRSGLSEPNLRVVDLDLRERSGPLSLERLVDRELDPNQGTVILTEGLLTYLAPEVQTSLWHRFAAALSGRPVGLFVANTELASEVRRFAVIRAFVEGLGRFVGEPVHLSFENEGEARGALTAAGFDRVELYEPADLLDEHNGPTVVRALAAWV